MKFRTVGLTGRERYYIDAREVTREEFERTYQQERSRLPVIDEDPSVEGNRPWSRPIHSDALAVHPEQIPEVMDRNARHGLHVHYDNDGCPVLVSRDQRRRLMKIERCHDNQGGYGDG